MKPQVAVSGCLLGYAVRFDGGHKHNPRLTGRLSACFDFVPLCPEVAIGLGVPRPAISLVKSSSGVIDAVSHADPSLNCTDALRDYGRRTAPTLSGICGYVFKANSPSCGLAGVRIHGGPPEQTGTGVYANEIIKAHPNLPVVEESGLADAPARENFLERVLLYARWRKLVSEGVTPGGLVAFHTAHKFAAMAHDEPACRALGRMVAAAGQGCCERYITRLMACMKVPATPGRHANVLMHIMGFFKDKLPREDKAELLRLIDAHRQGRAPLMAPITLINDLRRRYPSPYLDGQIYLEPRLPV